MKLTSSHGSVSAPTVNMKGMEHMLGEIFGGAFMEEFDDDDDDDVPLTSAQRRARMAKLLEDSDDEDLLDVFEPKTKAKPAKPKAKAKSPPAAKAKSPPAAKAKAAKPKAKPAATKSLLDDTRLDDVDDDIRRRFEDVAKLVGDVPVKTKTKSSPKKKTSAKAKSPPKEKPPTKAKRPDNTWMQALREWNSNNPSWCLPKRGTKEYDEVRGIQHRIITELPD